jgi:hypothetical protein
VRLINLDEGDAVADVARILLDDDEVMGEGGRAESAPEDEPEPDAPAEE